MFIKKSMSCSTCGHAPIYQPLLSYADLGNQVCQMLMQMDASFAYPPDDGRCELMCKGITQEQNKINTLAHGPGYIGTSKKMQYGKYTRTTPGLETVGNKKYTYSTKISTTCTTLFPALANKFSGTCAGTYVQYSPKTPMVENKLACFCKVEDPQVVSSYTSKLRPNIYTSNRGQGTMNFY